MYLVSSCLAGKKCRYDGRDNKSEEVMELVDQGQAILVCPERLGGLPTPRPSCEICMDSVQGKRVLNKEGQDCTKEFVEGAKKTLAIAKAFGIKKAILKSKSPSCGLGEIYDGTFGGKLIEGNGLLVEILLENGIEVITEKDL